LTDLVSSDAEGQAAEGRTVLGAGADGGVHELVDQHLENR
jgi:hypothetical protein